MGKVNLAQHLLFIIHNTENTNTTCTDWSRCNQYIIYRHGRPVVNARRTIHSVHIRKWKVTWRGVDLVFLLSLFFFFPLIFVLDWSNLPDFVLDWSNLPEEIKPPRWEINSRFYSPPSCCGCWWCSCCCDRGKYAKSGRWGDRSILANHEVCG